MTALYVLRQMVFSLFFWYRTRLAVASLADHKDRMGQQEVRNELIKLASPYSSFLATLESNMFHVSKG